jgi:predicted RNA-binding Zn ribbon-like protein
VTVDSATLAPLLGEPLPVEFMNTIWADSSGIHDALATPADVLGWMRAVRPPPAPHHADLDRWIHDVPAAEVSEVAPALRALRDALRRLAAEQTADPRTHAASAIDDIGRAVEVVNGAASAVPHWSHLEWSTGGPSRMSCTRAGAGAALMAAIAERAIDLFTGDARHELRACLAPRCVLYFVRQHPRREWCSTACGNRARAARHYQRHRSDSPAESGG